MPPENVRYLPTPRSRHYLKHTLPKCYQPKTRPTEIKEAKTRTNGYRRFYLTINKEIYRGYWKDNKKHGLGTEIKTKENEIYEGYFSDDKRSGYGVLSTLKPNGEQELSYEGSFENGHPNGKGDLHTDTYHFRGQVVNGKASGVGMAWYHDGTIYYGTWFNGKRMGEGMLILKNRNRYEGNWYNDKKHGLGQFCFFDRGQALTGVWVTDVCIRGTMRNIKYRQAATNPVRYAIPVLMLKDWASNYYEWEDEALARVGKYVREDVGIESIEDEKEDHKIEDQEESLSRSSVMEVENPKINNLRRSIDMIDQIDRNTKYTDITHIEPCVIFD